MNKIPQIGEVWTIKNRELVFTILDIRQSKGGWEFDVQVNGESDIRTAYYDHKFTRMQDYERLA